MTSTFRFSLYETNEREELMLLLVYERERGESFGISAAMNDFNETASERVGTNLKNYKTCRKNKLAIQLFIKRAG